MTWTATGVQGSPQSQCLVSPSGKITGCCQSSQLRHSDDCSQAFWAVMDQEAACSNPTFPSFYRCWNFSFMCNILIVLFLNANGCRRHGRLCGATVARLTPDQKAACSNHVRVMHILFWNRRSVPCTVGGIAGLEPATLRGYCTETWNTRL